MLRIAVETGLPYTAIKEVYDIGVGAYASSGSRPGMSGEQWGYGRVYAFIMSYFFNEDGRYDDQRFFQNKSDFHVLEKIMRKNPATDYSKFNPRNIPPEDIQIIYHSSPSDTLHQEKLDWSYGPFDGVLFFASGPYSLGPVKGVYAYLINKNNVIEVPDLFDAYYSGELDPTTKLKVEREVDTFAIKISLEEPYDFDTLADILSTTDEYIDYDDLEEYGLTYTGGGDTDIYALGWFQQASQARIGKILGYDAVKGIDEQGWVWMIDMLDGSNKNLVLIDEEDFDVGELYDALRLKKNPADPANCGQDWQKLLSYYNQSIEKDKAEFVELLTKLEEKVIRNKRGYVTLNDWEQEHFGFDPAWYGNLEPDELVRYLKDKVFESDDTDSLEDLAIAMSGNYQYGAEILGPAAHYIPAKYGMRPIDFIEKPFYFVHFTGQHSAALIEQYGFKGRTGLGSMYSTKQVRGKYSKESGYIFAYRLKANSFEGALKEIEKFMDKEIEFEGDTRSFWQATMASFAMGVASKGLEIFHLMDDEQQTIIPISCIDQNQVRAFPMFGEHHYESQEGAFDEYFDYEDFPELFEEDRENPSKFLEDYEYHLDYVEMDPYEVKEEMLQNYPMSAGDPEKFLEEHPKEFYNYFYLKNFIFIGPKGRCLKIYADDLVPLEGNIFYDEKLKAVAEAPNVFDFKIPFFVGFVDLFSLDCDEILEFTEQKLEDGDEDLRYDDFLHLTSEDVDNIFFQLRDGNHRSWGALLSGEEHIYAQVYQNTYQDYVDWVKSGKPKDVPGYDKFVYLDENLI